MTSRIESIGIYKDRNEINVPTFDLINKASEKCFESSRFDRTSVNVLIHVSVYRTKEFVEPAMAAYIQRDLGLNHDNTTGSEPKTLSFDLINGSLGFLHGCQVIDAMIESKKSRIGLIVSGNSKRLTGKVVAPKQTYSEIGIAMLLASTPNREEGFSSFYFRSFTEHLAANEYYVEHQNKRWVSIIDISPNIEQIYLDIYIKGITEYLGRNNRELSWYDYIIPPQVSSAFVSRIIEMEGEDPDKYVDVTSDEGDLMTASESVALERLRSLGLAKSGKKVLISNVGSGLQFGCATYIF